MICLNLRALQVLKVLIDSTGIGFCGYELAREVGIEPFGYPGKHKNYVVRHLPKPENRCGWELRCEVVGPTDPL